MITGLVAITPAAGKSYALLLEKQYSNRTRFCCWLGSYHHWSLFRVDSMGYDEHRR